MSNENSLTPKKAKQYNYFIESRLNLCHLRSFNRKFTRKKLFVETTCPPLELAVGGTYNNETCTNGTNIYNDTCELSCTQSYNLSSSDGVRRCTENGTWSNHVTCERKPN